MEATSDNRFYQIVDFKFVADLLLDLARERSLKSSLEKPGRAGCTHPATERVEVWLIDPGSFGQGANEEGIRRIDGKDGLRR